MLTGSSLLFFYCPRVPSNFNAGTCVLSFILKQGYNGSDQLGIVRLRCTLKQAISRAFGYHFKDFFVRQKNGCLPNDPVFVGWEKNVGFFILWALFVVDKIWTHENLHWQIIRRFIFAVMARWSVSTRNRILRQGRASSKECGKISINYTKSNHEIIHNWWSCENERREVPGRVDVHENQSESRPTAKRHWIDLLFGAGKVSTFHGARINRKLRHFSTAPTTRKASVWAKKQGRSLRTSGSRCCHVTLGKSPGEEGSS